MGQDITTALAVATGGLRRGSCTGCPTAGRSWTRAGPENIGKARQAAMASSDGFHLVLVLVPPPQALLQAP